VDCDTTGIEPISAVKYKQLAAAKDEISSTVRSPSLASWLQQVANRTIIDYLTGRIRSKGGAGLKASNLPVL